MKWEPKYGPAFLTGIFQIVLFTLGWVVLWFNLPADVRTANAAISDLKAATEANSKNIAEQKNRIIKLETAVEFIVPSLKRIEEAVARK